MTDIIVTTPKSEMANAAQEAENCKADKGGYYFRVFQKWPKALCLRDRIYYVEDGFIRGFGRVTGITRGGITGMVCDTTGRSWKGECIVFMPADSWTWIKPIPMRGFQGWRYFDKPLSEIIEVAGDWLAPKPETPQ